MTVAQNIGFPLAENTRMAMKDIRDLVESLLEMLELSHAIDLLPASLSGGMKKRVALARAVITNPEVVLFDEPTTGLHFEDIKLLLNVLNNLVQRGNTVIVIEHNMDVIKSSDWIIDIGP